jgi:hypothetical protein
VFMFLVVPWERIKQLLLFGAVLGTVFGTVHYYLLLNVFGAWRYQNVDLLSVSGLPILLIVAWLPYTIIFLHLLAQYRTPLLMLLLVLVAAFLPIAYQFLLEVNGMAVQRTWPWMSIFLYALGIHIFQAAFFYAVGLSRRQKVSD